MRDLLSPYWIGEINEKKPMLAPRCSRIGKDLKFHMSKWLSETDRCKANHSIAA